MIIISILSVWNACYIGEDKNCSQNAEFISEFTVLIFQLRLKRNDHKFHLIFEKSISMLQSIEAT